MQNVSGMPQGQERGNRYTGSFQGIAPISDIISEPTTISAGAVAAAGTAPTRGATNSASDEQESGDDGGDSAAAARDHSRGAFDVAGDGRGSGERAGNGRRGVGERIR